MAPDLSSIEFWPVLLSFWRPELESGASITIISLSSGEEVKFLESRSIASEGSNENDER